MKKINGIALTVAAPLLAALTITACVVFAHRPALNELLLASAILSGVYFMFTFVCLYLDWGIGRAKAIEFEQVPGLTKVKGLFGTIARGDGSGAVSLFDGVDDLAGCLLALVVSILAPIVLAVVVFAFSGLVELVVFVALLISYGSFYQVVRRQNLARRRVKGRYAASLGLAALYTLLTIGFVPIILAIAIQIKH